jgi:hypothetical protein
MFILFPFPPLLKVFLFFSSSAIVHRGYVTIHCSLQRKYIIYVLFCYCHLIDWIGMLRSLHVPSVTDPRAVSSTERFLIQQSPILPPPNLPSESCREILNKNVVSQGHLKLCFVRQIGCTSIFTVSLYMYLHNMFWSYTNLHTRYKHYYFNTGQNTK